MADVGYGSLRRVSRQLDGEQAAIGDLELELHRGRVDAPLLRACLDVGGDARAHWHVFDEGRPSQSRTLPFDR